MKTYEESEELQHSDAEITLGMRSILGIFFGLVLVCGVFFGFGYSLGRGNTGKVTASAQAVPQPLGTTPPSAVKTVVEDSDPSSAHASGNDLSTDAADSSGPTRKPAQALLPSKPSAASSILPVSDAADASPENVSSSNGSEATETSYGVPEPVRAVSPSLPVRASTTAAAAIMVQIAAVSHREDADVLVSALSRLGYSASVRSEAADKLLHVQIGPFPTLGEAKIMRTKLLNDGYNAILK